MISVITRLLLPTFTRLVQKPPLAALAVLLVMGQLAVTSVRVRSAYAGNEQVLPDTRQFIALAGHVATEGRFTLDGESPSARREPGYVAFVAAFVKCGIIRPHEASLTNLWPVVVAQIFLFGVATFGLARFTARQYGPLSGLLALLFTQGYWPVASQQHLPLSECLAMVCLAGAWLALGDSARLNRSWPALILGGAFLGILCVTKSIFVLAMPALLLFMWVRARAPVPWCLPRLAVLAVLVFAMPVAWAVRNHHHFHLPIMGSIDGVSSMYRGNVLPFQQIPSPEDPAMPAEGTSALAGMKSDGERYVWYKTHAMAIMKQEPVRYGLQCMNRVIYMLTEHDIANDPAWRALLLIKSDNVLLLLLLLVHLPTLLRRQKGDLHVEGALLMFVVTLALYGLVYGETRYLIPTMFLMTPLYAAAAAERIVQPLLSRFMPALALENRPALRVAGCAPA